MPTRARCARRADAAPSRVRDSPAIFDAAAAIFRFSGARASFDRYLHVAMQRMSIGGMMRAPCSSIV